MLVQASMAPWALLLPLYVGHCFIPVAFQNVGTSLLGSLHLCFVSAKPAPRVWCHRVFFASLACGGQCCSGLNTLAGPGESLSWGTALRKGPLQGPQFSALFKWIGVFTIGTFLAGLCAFSASPVQSLGIQCLKLHLEPDLQLGSCLNSVSPLNLTFSLL